MSRFAESLSDKDVGPMIACRLALLWIGLAAPAPEAAGDPAPPRQLEVVVDRLDVLAEPEDRTFATNRLARGDLVEVRKVLDGGWLAIAPPAGSFYWVDARTVDVLGDGRLYIRSETTTLRLGRPGHARTGPARRTIPKGYVLEPADEPPLDDPRGHEGGWLAALAGADEVRFVREAGVAMPARTVPRKAPPQAPPERRASHQEPDAGPIPGDLAGPLRQIEGKHRAVVARPVEGWDFAEVRRDYQALLARRGDDAPTRLAVRERLDRVDREAELSRAARDFEALVRKSRRRDAAIEQAQEALRAVKVDADLAYDAEGLLQATSRRVDGEKVSALLDREGQIVTYLRVPPGIETSSYLARRVGVRGKSRFNGELHFRLLDVADLEPLDRDP